MGRTIVPGSRVRLDHAERPRRGEVWAFVGPDGALVVHRVVRPADAGAWVLQGDGNRGYDAAVPSALLVGRADRHVAPGGGRERRLGRSGGWRPALARWGWRLRHPGAAATSWRARRAPR
jgi:hypothetical protein